METFSSPSSTPFQAHSRTTSRHRSNSSDGPVLSSPFEPFSPVHDDHDHEMEPDNAEDEAFSAFDPRRFTPTLHANLVSEILSLRRELEVKSKEIVRLETSFDESQNENEILNENVMKYTKENRSLKKQMQLLEGGTLTAISEIAKERDDAVENIGDVRKRLEQSQKKLKSKEDEVERTQTLYDRDKQAWDSERRDWERKVHIVENRLKTILTEVAAAQAVGNLHKINGDADAAKEDNASVRSSSGFGRRRASTTSSSTYDGEPLNMNSGRFSSMSFANANGPKGDGLNLADELAFDEDEEDSMELVDEICEMRPTSVASQTSLNTTLKARKILGLSMDGGAIAGVRELPTLDDPAFMVEPVEVKRQTEYRDVGIQFTPPPSPSLPASEPETVEELDSKLETTPTMPPEMVDSAVETVFVEMVSASCQTDDLPVPIMPDHVQVQEPEPEPVQPVKVPMVSIYTQTETMPEDETSEIEASPEEVKETDRIPVPMITIIPPGSEPTSPRTSVVLPPHTKSMASQTDPEQSYDLQSTAMQTEEIRIDRRPVKLPANLLPSAIIDQSADKAEPEHVSMPFISPPPRSPHRPFNKASEPKDEAKTPQPQPDLIQAYPGNNDNGPLAEDDTSDIRRPFRSSSLFAGFDDTGSETMAELPDVFSDDELYSRPTATYTLRSGKMVNRSGLSNDPLREEDEFDIDLPSTMQNETNHGRRPLLNSKNPTGSKQPDIRRAALITNGAAAHQRNRPRSPSDPSIDSASTSAARPPFPVPVRLSSRNVQASYSDRNQSPTPYSDGGSMKRKARRIARQPTVRKARSAAAAMQKNDRASSRSPPPMSTSGMSNSSFAPDSPQLPPLPPMPRMSTDEAVIYYPRRSGRKISSSRPSSARSHSQSQSHTIEEPAQDHGQSTTVVDAIAQTMVGEWMFKYVRRRKSFGMADNKDTIEAGKTTEEVSANITSTGVRHKRWVWLAPYERAIMWSSKQPTSGPALLGKNGRKLIIQSVIDVNDDTPLPKGTSTQPHFNKSILILTPQRALKFTAMTLERHIVWLRALSFLSTNSIGINELAALPPVPQEEYAAPPPTASLRRNHIRDSIRVAKAKPRPQPSKRSFTDHSTINSEYPGTGFDLEPIMDAADPPNVPRYSGHTRRRSNTAPKAPAPLAGAFRSFSSHATLPSNYSAITAASSDIYATSSVGAPGLMSGRSSVSRRTSEASGPSSIIGGNLFDPMGTMRMEAFIDRVDHPPFRKHNGHNNSNHRSRGPGKHENVQWNASNDFDLVKSDDGSEMYYRNDELFRGF